MGYLSIVLSQGAISHRLGRQKRGLKNPGRLYLLRMWRNREQILKGPFYLVFCVLSRFKKIQKRRGWLASPVLGYLVPFIH